MSLDPAMTLLAIAGVIVFDVVLLAVAVYVVTRLIGRFKHHTRPVTLLENKRIA